MRVAVFTDMSMTSYVQLLAYLPHRRVDLIVAYVPAFSVGSLLKQRRQGRITWNGVIKGALLYRLLRLRDGPSAIVQDWRNRLARSPRLDEGVAVWSRGARIAMIRRLFGVPVHVERRPHNPRTLARLTHRPLDLLFLLGGYIQKEPVLRAAKYTVTVHHSFLPRHRGYGGGEIWALVNRDLDALGTTIIRTDAGVDTGPVLVQERLTVQKGDTLESLTARNRLLAARLMLRTYDVIAAGNPVFTPQDDAQTTRIIGPPNAEQAADGLAWLASLTA